MSLHNHQLNWRILAESLKRTVRANMMKEIIEDTRADICTQQQFLAIIVATFLELQKKGEEIERSIQQLNV